MIAVTLHGDRLLQRLAAMFEALVRRRAPRPRTHAFRLDPARAHIRPSGGASFETRSRLRRDRSLYLSIIAAPR